MPAIAIVGPDGAGKTTITRALERSGRLPFRYLYMGINTGSSNVALPTSRLRERFRSSAGGGAVGTRRSGALRSAWAVGRLVNRIAEEWYRQVLSWSLQARGYVVLYDRHFLFDFAPGIAAAGSDGAAKRIHRWCLVHLYPRPDLVFYLDAPGEVLFARKGESTPEELERRRQAYLREGRSFPNFVRIDATRPLDATYAEIAHRISEYVDRRGDQAAWISLTAATEEGRPDD